MFIAAGSVHAFPLCKDYWDARKTGGDWRMHPPLSRFDVLCASNLVIARDWNGNCGTHVTSSGGYSVFPGDKVQSIKISWFNCNVGDTELSFGDFVDGTTEEECVTRCEGCATGPYMECTQVFRPKGH